DRLTAFKLKFLLCMKIPRVGSLNVLPARGRLPDERAHLTDVPRILQYSQKVTSMRNTTQAKGIPCPFHAVSAPGIQFMRGSPFHKPPTSKTLLSILYTTE
ncbi:MAG: hypothetical protein P4L75_07480, partial [Clostridia bacterium]|nr:hypothetical protein [Clostridia bacterium]